MNRHLRAAVLMSLGVLLVAAAPAAAFRIPDCFGLEATPGHLGTAGDDLIVGTSGNDVIIGLGGNDILRGGGGRDRICGGAGNDRIYGGAGGDLLDGEDGNDRVNGQGGNDGFVLGGDGRDVLRPGPGSIAYTATVEGGAGRDRVVIDAEGYNEVFGGPGRDTIDFLGAPTRMNVDLKWGEYGNNLGVPPIGGRVWQVEDAVGSQFDDFIWGNSRANRLYGYGGADTIRGRHGDDYLWGGLSPGDWLEGDAGFDTCEDPDGWIVMDECEA